MNFGVLLRRSVLPSLRSACLRGGPPNNKAKKTEASDEPKKKQAKVSSSSSKKKKEKGDTGDGAPSRHDMILEALKPRIIKKEPVPQEELERRAAIAKEYTRQMWKREHLQRRDEQTKMELMWEAINELPPDLRAEALKPDERLFPTHRWLPADTPPSHFWGTEES